MSESPPAFVSSPVGKSLRNSGLVYVSDTDPGYLRRRCGRGFIYLGLRGTRLTGKRTLTRIENLVIPPAWEEVWICAHSKGHLQATGRDERNRKQYIYHREWEKLRDKTKFDQLVSFAKVLPKIRRTVNRDLRRDPHSRRRVLALTVRILDETLIRVGNSFYAENNQSYGLTTLRKRHWENDREKAVFHFTGKSGREQEVELENQRLIQLISECQELPGQQLFQYREIEGSACPVRSEDLNDYLKGISGTEITAKIFRTWGATVEAAVQLYQLYPLGSPAQNKRKIMEAVKKVAAKLGNTPAVAREAYIAPQLFSAFENGNLEKKMAENFPSIRGLTSAEQSTLALLDSP